MGKQVNFYMTEQDEEEFFQFLISNSSICLFMDRMPADEIVPIHRLPDHSVLGWFHLWIWDQSCSPKPTLRYVEEQRFYRVDSSMSEVIQFSRSSMVDGFLIRGRIWADFSGFDASNPSVPIVKSECFGKLFNRLAGRIRRKGLRDAAGDYLLPGAARYVEAGGKTKQMATGKVVKLVHHD